MFTRERTSDEQMTRRVTEILSPAIDHRAPYAKFMIGKIVDMMREERDENLTRQLQQLEATMPRELMITVDIEGNYAFASRD